MDIHDDAYRRNTPPTPPHDIDLEQALLGTLLTYADTVGAVLDIVASGHFYDPVHQRIFDAIAKAGEGGRSVSPVALAHQFADDYVSEGLSVGQYLGRLATVAAPASQVRDLSETVCALATRRALMHLADSLAATSADIGDMTPDQIIEQTEGRLYALASREKYGAGAAPLAHAIDEALRRITDAHRNGNAIVGIATGLRDLDAKLGGLQPGELVVLAARPAMGKSALALNMAFDAAVRGVPVDFYSLEMSSSELAMRILADRVEISSDKLRRGQITSADHAEIARTASAIRGSPLYIDQTGGITIAQLAARARRQKRQRQTGLIVVDYLQLMRAAKSSGNRVQDVAEITTGLKALAKDLEVPILALSQLSRQVESRNDKRPMLSDLRESGSIEQDADVVMFVYREEYYLEREEPDFSEYEARADWQSRFSAVKGLGEIIIGKSRHSGVGTVKVRWDGARTRFFDLAHETGAR